MIAKIFIPRLNDPRMRYRFLAEPLALTNVQVRLPDARTAGGFLKAAYVLSRKNPGAVVLVGIGFKVLLLGIAARIGKKPVALRMGGDSRTDSREAIRASLSVGKYGTALRIGLNQITLGWILALSRHFIIVNADLEKQLRAQVTEGSIFHIVPQPAFGVLVDRTHKIEGAANLLTVTNLRYESKAQGVIWQIEQLKNNIASFPQGLTLRIAGNGDFLPKVEKYLEGANLPSNFQVRILGFVEEISSEYQRADIMIYRSEHDATPNVLLEAKRWGLPVLVNNYSSFLNIVVPGESALVYSSADEFCDALGRLVTDEKLRASLVKAGQEEFKLYYSLEAVASKLTRVVQSMLVPPK